MGIPEVGQTLSADTTGIADADGLTGAVFTFRWLAGDAEIAGATGSTHTLTGDDLGKAIRVRVTFTDDGGNEESLTSEPTVAVAVGLELQSATVDGAILTLTCNAILDNSVTLSSGDFAVNVAGSSRSISGVSVGGHSVTLTLSSAVAAGNTVTVDYTAPSSRFADAIRDTVRRRADSFTGQAVTNNTTSGNQRSEPVQTPDRLKVATRDSGQIQASWNAPIPAPLPPGTPSSGRSRATTGRTRTMSRKPASPAHRTLSPA